MSKEPANTSANKLLDQGSIWKVESLRFTAFLNPGVSLDWSNWWMDIVGEVPEAKIERPREGTIREEGPFLWGRLVLAVEPLRVDWVLSGDIKETFEKGTLDFLPDFATSVPEFSESAKRWIAKGFPIIRLAWGAVLMAPVRDREEGYRRLASYLPSLKIDPVGSSELHYQINRRRISARHAGLSINRLSKWSVARIQSARLQIGPIPSGLAPMHTVGNDLSACRLELDINTAVENAVPFPADVAQALLGELAELAIEISKEGDLP